MENEAIPVAEYEKLTEKFRVHGLLRPQGLREGPRGRVRGGRQGLRVGFYYSLWTGTIRTAQGALRTRGPEGGSWITSTAR